MTLTACWASATDCVMLSASCASTLPRQPCAWRACGGAIAWLMCVCVCVCVRRIRVTRSEKERLEEQLRSETQARAVAESQLHTAKHRVADAEAESKRVKEEVRYAAHALLCLRVCTCVDASPNVRLCQADKVREHNLAISEALEANVREKDEVQDLARMLLEEVRRLNIENGGEDVLEPFVEELDHRFARAMDSPQPSTPVASSAATQAHGSGSDATDGGADTGATGGSPGGATFDSNADAGAGTVRGTPRSRSSAPGAGAGVGADADADADADVAGAGDGGVALQEATATPVVTRGGDGVASAKLAASTGPRTQTVARRMSMNFDRDSVRSNASGYVLCHAAACLCLDRNNSHGLTHTTPCDVNHHSRRSSLAFELLRSPVNITKLMYGDAGSVASGAASATVSTATTGGVTTTVTTDAGGVRTLAADSPSSRSTAMLPPPFLRSRSAASLPHPANTEKLLGRLERVEADLASSRRVNRYLDCLGSALSDAASRIARAVEGGDAADMVAQLHALRQFCELRSSTPAKRPASSASGGGASVAHGTPPSALRLGESAVETSPGSPVQAPGAGGGSVATAKARRIMDLSTLPEEPSTASTPAPSTPRAQQSASIGAAMTPPSAAATGASPAVDATAPPPGAGRSLSSARKLALELAAITKALVHAHVASTQMKERLEVRLVVSPVLGAGCVCLMCCGLSSGHACFAQEADAVTKEQSKAHARLSAQVKQLSAASQSAAQSHAHSEASSASASAQLAAAHAALELAQRERDEAAEQAEAAGMEASQLRASMAALQDQVVAADATQVDVKAGLKVVINVLRVATALAQKQGDADAAARSPVDARQAAAAIAAASDPGDDVGVPQLRAAALACVHELSRACHSVDVARRARARTEDELAMARAFQGVTERRADLASRLDDTESALAALRRQLVPLQAEHDKLRAACGAQQGELQQLAAAREALVTSLAALQTDIARRVATTAAAAQSFVDGNASTMETDGGDVAPSLSRNHVAAMHCHVKLLQSHVQSLTAVVAASPKVRRVLVPWRFDVAMTLCVRVCAPVRVCMWSCALCRRRMSPRRLLWQRRVTA